MHRRIAVFVLMTACEGDAPQPAKAEAAPKEEGSYIDKSKATEAKTGVKSIAIGASSFFNEEHVERGGVELIGAGGGAAASTHQCPNDGNASGSVGPTPPLSLACGKGIKGQCTPSGQGEGAYAMSAWTDDKVWNQLGFQMELPHRYHYGFKWNNSAGSCKFTAQAFGDLDDDGVFSTYELAGAADENGVNIGTLFTDKEFE